MNPTVSHVLRQLAGRQIGVTMEKLRSLPLDTAEVQRCLQGGGTDGTYGYFILVTLGDSATAMSTVYKLDLTTWETVRVSDPLPMYHANDLAYDPQHHRLVVSHCDIHPDQVSLLDPDTLERIGVLTIPQPHFSIAYEPSRQRYVAGKSRTYDLALLDPAFQPVKLLQGQPGYVKQGLACDETYIYFFQTGQDANWIFVYDWEGGLITKIPVPMVGESENLFPWEDGFIAAFNNKEGRTADIYRLRLKPLP